MLTSARVSLYLRSAFSLSLSRSSLLSPVISASRELVMVRLVCSWAFRKPFWAWNQIELKHRLWHFVSLAFYLDICLLLFDHFQLLLQFGDGYFAILQWLSIWFDLMFCWLFGPIVYKCREEVWDNFPSIYQFYYLLHTWQGPARLQSSLYSLWTPESHLEF